MPLEQDAVGRTRVDVRSTSPSSCPGQCRDVETTRRAMLPAAVTSLRIGRWPTPWMTESAARHPHRAGVPEHVLTEPPPRLRRGPLGGAQEAEVGIEDRIPVGIVTSRMKKRSSSIRHELSIRPRGDSRDARPHCGCMLGCGLTSTRFHPALREPIHQCCRAFSLGQRRTRND